VSQAELLPHIKMPNSDETLNQPECYQQCPLTKIMTAKLFSKVVCHTIGHWRILGMNKYDFGLVIIAATKSISKQSFQHTGNGSKYMSYTTRIEELLNMLHVHYQHLQHQD
jgi:hypothetical protein